MQLPSDFIQQMTQLLGETEFNQLQDVLQGERITSIRTNPQKCSLSVDGSLSENVPWCPTGHYLKERPVFTLDPLFHAGAYYAQEASSMFVEQAIRQHIDRLDTDEPLVLDLCAAPGGKSTHLSSILNGKGWLVSNEVMKSRVGVLDENLTKWGEPHLTVTNNDPKDFAQLQGLFDILLIDAPCSGEGMFRKDDKAIEDWSINNVKLCCERQQRIVADAYPALKEGGILIYSTCTYNEEEDEKNVQWIAENLNASVLPIHMEEDWNVTTQGYGYHFFPHKTKGEGFFLAVLQKNEEVKSLRIKTPKQIPFTSKSIADTCSQWLKGTDWKFIQKGDEIIAVEKKWLDISLVLQQSLRTVHNGLHVGTMKGKDILPSEDLALSYCLQSSAFPQVNCSWEMAIQYLKKENLILEGQNKGIVLFCYQGIPLGFGKNLGNRCNNLYPSEWHIRMAPDKENYKSVLNP